MHNPSLMYGLIAASTLSVTGLLVVAALWMKKLRDTVAQALTEAASQQVRNAQRVAEALGQVQKQQRNYEQQLQLLAQANTQLRQGLVSMATRLEHSGDAQRNEQTIH